MKKQKKQILILGAVLILLLAAYFILPKVVKEPEEEEEKSYAVTVLDATLATKLAFTNDGTELSFVKEGENWYFETDKELSVVQSSIENMVEKAGNISSSTKIDNVTDFAQYGLDNPLHTVKLTVDGKEYVIQMGDCNDITGEYYVRLEGETTVYTVPATTVTPFSTSIDALTEEE